MAKPTYTASIEGKEKANAAFKRSGKTQEFIAGTSGTTRQLVGNFLKGLSVEQPKFIAICEALELRWQEIAELDEVEVTDDSNRKKLELLVQEVKQKIAADVTERCGTMRVLDMTQPVDLDRIYTDVNILEKISGEDRIDCDDVLQIGSRENFEHWMMGKIQHRITGLKAIEKHQKLVVLGKPGAGKTTFMKYLAMSCLSGKFYGELVPIFVTLKAYAEEDGQPSLQDYIFGEFRKRKTSPMTLVRLLEEGKALILLDGLDEVKKEDDQRIKRDIDKFSRYWLQNRFAITCRIAAREYQFERFTEVEVADFDQQQIETFVNNWFREKDSSKANRLLERLKGKKPVKELAKSPLLLTLLCLVFGERNDLPPKRSELYKEGLEVLMKKWDAKRNIEREQIYKLLSPQNKEDMLGLIAFNTFVNGEYFFRKEDLQRQIKDYICNLPEASADPDVLRLDSEVVLKAIEHHHGLLVERARNIYSFSHLTFQEYFTAREIERERYFERLIENISNPRWKEVFYLTAEILRRSDDFLKMMKDSIDEMLANDEKLQAFLEWVNQKTNSVEFSYKSVSVRAFYSYVEASARALSLAQSLDIDISIDIDRSFALDRDRTLIRDHPHTQFRDRELARELALDRELAHARSLALNRGRERDRFIEIALDLVLSLARARRLARSSELGADVLRQALQSLQAQIPSKQADIDIDQWWRNHGEKLSNELRQICINHRNIGYNWKFTDDQVELLNQYYTANLFLVEIMNRSYVSKQVREEIEATMLLPRKK
ncbi:NACHT domain-containing NTPase [Pseudanabaena sp. BC1403]|uniref:NACHT domain-containing protein n=1 Tax=Pseudanabaena sp. BC1403 TaxID=2043171 RepID=UPI000CD8F686|nr:NACHT domain-containing NTPase [Pseudanabaena sp. BC1403]